MKSFLSARFLLRYLSWKKGLACFALTLTVLLCAGALSPVAAATITAREYFIDTDPGEGNGVPIVLPVGSDTSFRVNLSGISTDNLAAGSHLLYVRAMDSEGVWGPSRQIRFIMLRDGLVLEPEYIDGAEYFVDHDPGEGHGISIAATDGTFYNMDEA